MDGLVEWLNKTLKSMLSKTAGEGGKDWDKLIPFLLFAYSEVPQDSTGFYPFQLLYGRAVRGPLDVLWVSDKKSDINVVSYIMLMCERLDRMCEEAQENMKSPRAAQKVWHDRKAK